MPAAVKNIVIEQRSTFRLRLTWKDAKGKPVNLAGYQARMQGRATHASADALFDASTTNGKITFPAPGVIQIVIPASETDTFTFTTGVYDLKLIAPNGEEIRLLKGTVKLDLGVTE